MFWSNPLFIKLKQSACFKTFSFLIYKPWPCWMWNMWPLCGFKRSRTVISMAFLSLRVNFRRFILRTKYHLTLSTWTLTKFKLVFTLVLTTVLMHAWSEIVVLDSLIRCPSLIINIQDPYLILNHRVCRDYIETIICVHSATSNINKRNSIRQTWRNSTLLLNQNMSLVFLLGMPRNVSEQKQISEENMLHMDVVQGHFIDSYQNLSHKAILGLRWVTEHCTTVKTIVKVDDDVLVNPFLLNVYLSTKFEDKRSIYCRLKPQHTDPIHRFGKWKVSYTDFPGLLYYPFKSCPGFMWIFSMEIAVDLLNAARTTPLFWIDDVYVTGILADQVVNVTHVDIGDTIAVEEGTHRCYTPDTMNCSLLAMTASCTSQMRRLWRQISNHQATLWIIKRYSFKANMLMLQ